MKKLYIVFAILTLMNSPVRSQYGWFFQNSPSTDSYNSVYFTDYNTGWAVGSFGTIFKTTNGGVSWLSQISPTSNDLLSVNFINNNTGFAVGDFETIIKTTNGGTNWTLVSSGTGNKLYSVDFVDNVTGWVVGVSGKIIKTTNGGTSWTSQSILFGHVLRSVIFIDNNIGWTVGSAILKTTTGGEPVGVWNISSGIPMNFELSQNFPNPFNPSTNIAFLVSKYSNVKINVYDSQGKEVVTLLNERLSAGSYRVDFDGTGYSSGIYFYKMETEDFVQTKSMVLLK